MSLHWLPAQVLDDFQPTLLAGNWLNAERDLIMHFLKLTLPFRHKTLLVRAASIYIDHFSIDDSGSSPDAAELLKNFTDAVGEQQTYFPTRHYRMSHPFTAGLLDLQKRITRENLGQFLDAYQYIAGWRGADQKIESAEQYYEHMLDIKGALLHVAERHPDQLLHRDEIPSLINTLCEEASKYDDLPTGYSRVANLKRKLLVTTRLINGTQLLGAKLRSPAELGIDNISLQQEMDTLANQPPLSEELKAIATQHAKRVIELSEKVRVVRRTKPERDFDQSPKDSNEVAEGLATFESADPITQAAAIRTLSEGEIPALFKPMKSQLDDLRGASSSVIRRRLSGMHNALAKRNNPSPSQFNTHPRSQILHWLIKLYADDPKLTVMLLLVWMTGLHPKLLLQNHPTAEESIVELDCDTLHYRVLNHHAVTEDRLLPKFSLLLPRSIMETLRQLRASEKSEEILSDLSTRYRNLHKEFRKSGDTLPRFIATWRHSQPGFCDQYFSRFERNLLAGELPFEDWAHSAYKSSDLEALNHAFRKATMDAVSELQRLASNETDPKLRASADAIARALNYGLEPSGQETSPKGYIGSTYQSDKRHLQEFLKTLYKGATRYRREFNRAGAGMAQVDAGVALLNLTCVNYFLILLASTGARPHSARMVVTPWMNGLRIEDKDSAGYREFRVIAMGSDDTWAQGKTLLQQQRNSLIETMETILPIGKAMGVTIETMKPTAHWQPKFLKCVGERQYRWAPLTQSMFWGLSANLMRVPNATFRLNHFRHVLANIQTIDLETEKRTQLGHTGPGLEAFGEHSAEANLLTNLFEASDLKLWDEYGFQIIKVLKTS